MSQPIHCDAPGCPELAVVIVGAIVSGDQAAWCWDHYLASCAAIVEQAVQAEADATAAEAVARIAEVTPPAGSDQEPDVPGITPDSPIPPAGEPFPGTAQVRRRHHPPVVGRQEYPAPADAGEVAPEATPDGIAAPGPSTEPTGATEP